MKATEDEASSLEISREELLSRLTDPRLAIVNVLPEVAFEESRISGSVSLPLADIETRAHEVLPDPHQEIVVYCGRST